ncbi:MAG: FAD-binding oxidoreductase [Hyphomicrobiales bacterium]
MPAFDPVTSNTTLPKKADAVVIGGGIAGIMTALELSERGYFVVVLEKGEVAAEQSGRNWGWVRQMGRDPREAPLITIALNKWRAMNARIGAETGFRECGILYMSETDAEQAGHAKWLKEVGEPNGIRSQLLSSKEVAQRAPGSLRVWRGGMFTADDGRAEPFIAVPAMARALQARRGEVFTHCAARGLERKAGRVSAVVTEKGTIETDTVVVAAGYWTRRFLRREGVRFKQLGVISSVMRTAPRESGMKHTFAGSSYAVRKRLDGGYTIANNMVTTVDLTPAHLSHMLSFRPLLWQNRELVKMRLGGRFFREAMTRRNWALDEVSPFERLRMLDPKPNRRLLRQALEGLQADYPAFQGIEVVEQWAGMIDATPDAVPVIDAVAKLPGLYVLSGLSGHGFGLGPGAGKLMAEIITGEKPCVDPTPFKLSRFGLFRSPKPTTGL